MKTDPFNNTIDSFSVHPSIQVPVTVYYESLCPDSKAFIVEQLTPVVRSPLGKYVDLMLVPYGKSSVRRTKIIEKAIAN